MLMAFLELLYSAISAASRYTFLAHAEKKNRREEKEKEKENRIKVLDALVQGANF